LENQDAFEACCDASVLAINLFATVGVHIAERLGIPLVVTAPYMIPYPMPASANRQLSRQGPRGAELVKRLQSR
jgi:hypothetical protein